MKKRRGGGDTPTKPVYMWDLEGNRLESFDDYAHAAEVLGVTNRYISRVIQDGTILDRRYRLTNTPTRPEPIDPERVLNGRVMHKDDGE